ncbi:MAG: GatB/YqeY domain-containing protein [Patescibacteria group bacterium]
MLKDQITTEIKEAMKAGDTERLSTLRMLLAAFGNMEIEKRGAGQTQLEDKDYQAVVKREVKKRQEAIEIYKTAGRAELQEKEEQELKLLSTYLPEEMGEAEVKVIVDAVVSEMGTANMGAIIGEVKKRSDGKADGGLIAKLVKEKIG